MTMGLNDHVYKLPLNDDHLDLFGYVRVCVWLGGGEGMGLISRTRTNDHVWNNTAYRVDVNSR